MLTFQTPRLLMRPLQAEDELFYCACYTDPVLMQHIGEPLAHEVALRSFKAALKVSVETPIRRYTWVIQEKTSGVAAGLLAMFCDQAKPEPVNAELGTIMLADFQNQGFTVEALDALADVAFNTTRLEALLVKHKAENKAVAAVMGRLGYLRDATDASEIARYIWVLNRIDWQARGNPG
ncbi:MAG: GNAT family N-acetyltransferase [Arenimonas sp.]